MEFLVGAALALFSAIVLAYPFLTARNGGRHQDLAPSSPVPSPELASVYQAIRDLMWERQTGDLPEDLYQQQLDTYRREAALLLRDAAAAQEAGEALERQVATELAALGGLSARDAGP